MRQIRALLAFAAAAALAAGCAQNFKASPAGRIAAPKAPFAAGAAELYQPVPAMFADKIVSGSKALIWNSGVRGGVSPLQLLIDEQEVLGARMQVSPEAGWNPFTAFDTSYDPRKGIERSCPFKTTATAGGTFRQRIFLRPDGKAEFTLRYEMGDYATLKGPVLVFSIPKPACFGRTLAARGEGGERAYSFPDTDEKWTLGAKHVWHNCFHVRKPSRIEFDPEQPGKGFALEFPPDTCDGLTLFRASGTAELYFSWTPRCRTEEFSVILDFGRSARTSKPQCVVNGINFTLNNDYDVPCYDERGNLLVNPSFESGPRYYHNVPSGSDLYPHITEAGARSGRYALACGAKTFNFPTVAGKDYTFSYYARATVTNRCGGSIHCDTYLWKNPTKPKWLGYSREWERYAYTVTNWPFRAIAFQIGADPGVLIDDVQFEEGAEATEYKGNPLGIELKTDAPDTFYAPLGTPFHARLAVRGPKACRGVIAITVQDFFGRDVWKGGQAFDLARGEVTLPPLPESAFAARGVYAVRMRVKGEGFKPYFDCVRLARFPYADGTAPNRRLHQTTSVTWPVAAQTNAMERIRHLYQVLGLDPHCYALGGHGRDFDPGLGRAIAARSERYGFHVDGHIFHTQAMQDTGFKTMETYSDDLVKKVAGLCEEYARTRPYIGMWYGPGEASGWVRTCQNRDWKEFAKLMRAAHEGIHRGNPKARFSAYGTCNLGEQGRGEILAFLGAAKALWPDFRFDTVDVHPYRPHPEFPDYDRDWKALLDGLGAIEYDGMTVEATEGGYFVPIRCVPWAGVAPWQDTLSKDSYCSQHVPSMDIGWGERAAAAMLLRYNLVSYKYGARIGRATSWGLKHVDSRNPFAQYVATAAQTELLGKAAFLEDVRFAPGARAYVFDDREGHAVAAVWRFTLGMDYGTENASAMTLDLAKLDPEIFDMMGNRVMGEPLSGREGCTRLPLGNFPVYLRVAKRDAKRLAKAIRAAETDIPSQAEIKAREVQAVRAPHTPGEPEWGQIGAVAFPGGKARFAWNEETLYLRWETDTGAAPVLCFDALADERENARIGFSGADENDLVYVVRGKNGQGSGHAAGWEVFRREAPDHQLTGGIGRSLLPHVVEPAVRLAVEGGADRPRAFTLAFPRRQLEPMRFAEGGRFGFAQNALGFCDGYVEVSLVK
ncbi:MAG: hypothetical protein RBT78_03800 [Kiritimatiellia bacterium]|jgi:hypothetical protein|nr:hypothetical protein [Kiritimatiellia bacterium]